MTRSIRVYVIDDHEQVSQALVNCLGNCSGVEVLGHTGDLATGLLQVASLLPDVVLVDPKRSDGRGLELINRIARNWLGVRVLAYTSFTNEWEEWVVRGAGAAGYILKDIGCRELIQSIFALSGSALPRPINAAL